MGKWRRNRTERKGSRFSVEIVRKLPETFLFPKRELWKIGVLYFVAWIYGDGVVQVRRGNVHGTSVGDPLFTHNMDTRSMAEKKALKYAEERQ